VDGLAGGVGLIASVTFGSWFYSTGDLPLSLLAFSLAGALLGFLFFNFQPAKIFMGDSGSLILGFILYVLAMKLIEYPPIKIMGMASAVCKPVLVIGILSYPLMDTLRVFTLRVWSGNHPFKADKNHIHHRLLALGLSHKMTSLVLYLFTVIMIVISFLTPADQPNLSLLIVVGTAALLTNVIYLNKVKE
jgi:UDP-N-acetylmuramyl pentapeptide phosphotransferase/UDP-N-acetylglucosamine-1-phosphate transferase